MSHTEGTDSENYLRAPNLASCDRIGYPLSAMIAQVQMKKRKTRRLSQCAFRFTRRRAHRVSDSTQNPNLRSADFTDYADSKRGWQGHARETFRCHNPSVLVKRNSLNLCNLWIISSSGSGFKNSRKRERSDFWRFDPPLKGRCQTR
jgi:hypothetical protein